MVFNKATLCANINISTLDSLLRLNLLVSLEVLKLLNNLSQS